MRGFRPTHTTKSRNPSQALHVFNSPRDRINQTAYFQAQSADNIFLVTRNIYSISAGSSLGLRICTIASATRYAEPAIRKGIM